MHDNHIQLLSSFSSHTVMLRQCWFLWHCTGLGLGFASWVIVSCIGSINDGLDLGLKWTRAVTWSVWLVRRGSNVDQFRLETCWDLQRTHRQWVDATPHTWSTGSWTGRCVRQRSAAAVSDDEYSDISVWTYLRGEARAVSLLTVYFCRPTFWTPLLFILHTASRFFLCRNYTKKLFLPQLLCRAELYANSFVACWFARDPPGELTALLQTPIAGSRSGVLKKKGGKGHERGKEEKRNRSVSHDCSWVIWCAGGLNFDDLERPPA